MKKTSHPQTVVFVCEQGAAKSVVAAAHFNKLADESDLNVRAIARGTTPGDEILPKVLQGLQAENLTASVPKPERLSPTDIAGAVRVVAFCDLPEAYRNQAAVEQWSDVPLFREDYNKSRDAILVHINDLLNALKKQRDFASTNL